MSFFTRTVYQAASDNGEAVRRAQELYNARLEEIGERLTPEVKAIADAFYLDDALIAKLRQEEEGSKLLLVLRCGNLQTGYFDLFLTYHDARISDQDLRELTGIAAQVRSQNLHSAMDVCCHEIDISDDGRLEHRLVFNKPAWITISCSKLSVTRIERAGRKLPPYALRYLVDRLGLSSTDSGVEHPELNRE